VDRVYTEFGRETYYNMSTWNNEYNIQMDLREIGCEAVRLGFC